MECPVPFVKDDSGGIAQLHELDTNLTLFSTYDDYRYILSDSESRVSGCFCNGTVSQGFRGTFEIKQENFITLSKSICS